MDKIFKSASRIVLILMTIALIVLTFLRIVSGDDFVKMLGMIFAFYFGQKNLTKTDDTK